MNVDDDRSELDDLDGPKGPNGPQPPQHRRRASLRKPASPRRTSAVVEPPPGPEEDDLTDAEIVELTAALHALREELRLSLSQSADGAKAVDLEAPIGRLSRIDAIQQQKMVQAQRSRLVTRLEQVRAALAKVADDAYGECNRCDEPIGYKRLKSKPESPLCLTCQTRLERR